MLITAVLPLGIAIPVSPIPGVGLKTAIALLRKPWPFRPNSRTLL